MKTDVLEDLQGWAGAWDRLVDCRSLPSPFLRSWWLSNAARGQPRFVVVRDGERLVGGIALEEDRLAGIPRLRVLGNDLAPDHCGVIAEPGQEDEVAEHIVEWLCRPGARTIDLVGVDNVGGLNDRLSTRGQRAVVDTVPFATLAPTLDQFLAAKPRKVRYRIRTLPRRLEERGAVYRVLTGEEAAGALDTLERLHVESLGHVSHFLRPFPRFARAALAGAARGEVVFHELLAGGVPIASSVTFDVAGRISIYQNGRSTDPHWSGSGQALWGHILARACERGHREADLLRGAAEYKLRWATGSRELWRVRASHGRRAGLVAAAASRAAARRARRT